MATRVWLMIRVAALAVLLLGVAISHHASGAGEYGQLTHDGAASAAAVAEGTTGTAASMAPHSAEHTETEMDPGRVTARAAGMIPVGYQDNTGHFGADGPAESAAGDHDDEPAHCLMSLCMAVLVLLLGTRIRPTVVSRHVLDQRLEHANTNVPARMVPPRAGVSLLLSLCVMRT